MAEGGVETISETLDSMSLSSTPDQRDALGKALNLSDEHAMLSDDMVQKVKRRVEEKEKKQKKTASTKTVNDTEKMTNVNMKTKENVNNKNARKKT